MKFTIQQNSRQGPRPYNQDRLAYSYTRDALLMVIADGMGGYRHGEVAAQLAVKSITQAFQALAKPHLANPVEFLTAELLDIQRKIETLTDENELLETPRTTIVVAIVQGHQIYCAHVGDSRLYHIRDGEILFRTEDHSIVQKLFRRGLLKSIEMLTHPDRHKIYNCLGGDKAPKIEISHLKNLQEGDVVMLCSDGLWSMIPDDQLRNTLKNTPVTQAIPHLLDMAEQKAHKDGDNMSAIGLQWGDIHRNSLAVSTVTMPLDMATTIINDADYLDDDEDKSKQKAIDLSEDAIEKAIAEIQSALKKTNAD